MFPLFQSSGTLHDFSKIVESTLGTTSVDTLRTLGCISGPVDSHRTHIGSQGAWNLIFSYIGRDFALPVPGWSSIQLWGVGRDVASEDIGEMSLSTSAFSLSTVTNLPVFFIRRGTFSFTSDSLCPLWSSGTVNSCPYWAHPYTTG